MTDAPDTRLLEQFVRQGSEAAFTALVERYLDLVYSTALRRTNNAHAAEDIAQAVFIILARKAGSLGRRTVLPSWLYRTAQLTTANWRRSETRRTRREQEAYMQSTLIESSPDEAWRELAPLLDDAMARLGATDRDAIVLRFFENKSLREVGLALDVEERAAQKRVSRGLERLRVFFNKRGIPTTPPIICGAIAANSVHAAPVGLAKTISTVAVAKGAAVSGSTLTLVKGALKIMAWTKAKTAIAVGTGILFAAGTTTVTVKEIQKHEAENVHWQAKANLNSAWLEKAPPLLKVVPTKFPNGAGEVGTSDANGNWKAIGLGYTVEDLLECAYQGRGSRTVFRVQMPDEKYDFIVTAPSEGRQWLQTEIKKQFGVAGRFETIETNVLFLTVKTPNAAGLRAVTSKAGNQYEENGPGRLSGTNQTLSGLASMLEGRFRIPIIDQTGLANRYDFHLAWDEYGKKAGNSYPDYPNLEGLKQALADQLGLELLPGTAPVEMLVVENAK